MGVYSIKSHQTKHFDLVLYYGIVAQTILSTIGHAVGVRVGTFFPLGLGGIVICLG